MVTKRSFIIVCLIVFVLGGLAMYHNWQESRIERAIALSSEQLASIESLENELEISKRNAEKLQAEVEKAQTNQVQPATYITVTAPTAEKVVEKITEQIDNKDTSLPAAALEQSDRTVITKQLENEEYKVGVYKINLNKQHKIKAGTSYIADQLYLSAGYQNKRTEFITHINKEGKIKGGTVLYTIKEW